MIDCQFIVCDATVYKPSTILITLAPFSVGTICFEISFCASKKGGMGKVGEDSHDVYMYFAITEPLH